MMCMMSEPTPQIAKIRTWNNIDISDTLLHLAFAELNTTALANVYIPVKIPTASGMPDEYTYRKVGYDSDDIADYYETLYGENYLSVPLIKQQVEGETNYATSLRNLSRKIMNIYKINEPKYLKLIELQGYTWNPLWNVDGSEKYTYLENSGVNDTSSTKTYGSHTDTGSETLGGYTVQTTDNNIRSGGETKTGNKSETHEDTNSVTSFDDNTFNNDNHNIGSVNTTGESESTTYNNLTDKGTGSSTYGSRENTSNNVYGSHTDSDNTTVTHHNALNGSQEYSGGTDGFGNNVTGGDKYHTDIRERQGNTGDVKIAELIRDAIETYRFNILQEFFNDINEILLVGIYDL